MDDPFYSEEAEVMNKKVKVGDLFGSWAPLASWVPSDTPNPS